MPGPQTQRDKALALLARQGVATMAELRLAGVTGATVGRMEWDGEVIKIARGLYQRTDVPLDPRHGLAEAAKQLPRGIICLTSALAFHGLTDEFPKRTWVAIGRKDWAPRRSGPKLRIARFADRLLAASIEVHVVEGVPIKVFGIAKTIADCFRYRRKIGLPVAVEGLQEALRQHKATPAEIISQAEYGGVATVIRPYLDALSANG
jgi:predicted transcriptional regulator of viral defense system